jgi:hypothetical protein
VFGAYALIDGLSALVAAARGRQLAGGGRGWLLLEACSASAPAWSRSSGPTAPPWPCCG